MVGMNGRYSVFGQRRLFMHRLVEYDALFGAPDARVADTDRPRVRQLTKAHNRAVGVGLGALAAECKQAVPEPVALVAVLASEATGVEVCAARAMLVDGPTVCEQRTTLVVERRQTAESHELEHGAQEVVGIRRATRNGHNGRALEDLRSSNGVGRIRIGRRDPAP